MLMMSCSSRVELVEPIDVVSVKAEPIERPILNLPLVDRFNAKQIKIHVITKNNIDEKCKEIKTEEPECVFFAMTPKHYENNAVNWQEILKIERQLKKKVNALQEWQNIINATIDQHNDTLANTGN